MILVETNLRDVYDGNTEYHMFDEVFDELGMETFVLVVPVARGQSYLDRNLWKPTATMKMPYMELTGTEPRLDALINMFQLIGLMNMQTPVVTLLSNSDLEVDAVPEDGSVSLLCEMEDPIGRAATYKWYSCTTPAGGGIITEIEGEIESELVVDISEIAETTTLYRYAMGYVEGGELKGPVFAITVTVAE